jgi:hypothetical protein
MRSRGFLSAALIAAAALVILGPRASAEIIVSVDKDTQRMTITVDGEQRYLWPVSTGRPGNDTPNGVFRPNRMDPDHFSQEWDNAPMPHAIFFDLHGHALHGFLNPSHIGDPASHGCVRMQPERAALLYMLIAMRRMKDTTVVVTGRTPSPQGILVARRQALGEASAVLPPEVPSHSDGTLPPHDKDQVAELDPAQEAGALQQQLAVYEKLLRQPAPRPQPVALGQRPTLNTKTNNASAQPDYRAAKPPYYAQQLYYPDPNRAPRFGQPMYYYVSPSYPPRQYYVVRPRNPY